METPVADLFILSFFTMKRSNRHKQWASLYPNCWICFKIFFFFSRFLGLHSWHMQVPIWVKLELQLLTQTTAIAIWDPSCICDVHHSTQQHCDPQPTEWGQGSNLHPPWILNRFISVSHNGNSTSRIFFFLTRKQEIPRESTFLVIKTMSYSLFSLHHVLSNL